MYNTVQLLEEHWCFQRYIWQNEIGKRKIPEEKVIKTLIYGVNSSGNQSESELCETACMSAVEFPEVNHIVQKDIYVDSLSGAQNLKDAMTRADQIELVLNRTGFSIKGVTFSGKDPSATLTNDESSINKAAMRRFPKGDLLSLDISELNLIFVNTVERSHHSNRISFQQILQEGTVFQKCLRYLTCLARSH